MSASPTLDEAVNKLIELLSLEKSHLLSGAYKDVPEITEQKLFYMAILSESIENGNVQKSVKSYYSAIKQIKTLASENEALLQAAKNGVNAAKSRIKSIMTRESYVGAYTENGQKLRTHDCGVTRQKNCLVLINQNLYRLL